MASIKRERRRARESALALLYSSDITASHVEDVIESGAYPADDFEFSEYAEKLVLGVAEHGSDIDETLASTSENWALDRMPVVDRALLRLAVYEMLYVDDVPISVAINEAVELAKAYGGEDDSARFVNGVLGRIARSVEGGPAEGESDDDEAVSPAHSTEVLTGQTDGDGDGQSPHVGEDDSRDNVSEEAFDER